MPRLPAAALSALIPVLGLSLPAQAARAPIVFDFDFEDGLQAWELSGSAQRVQTQVLGGEWAIFGDGLVGAFDIRTFISMETDLTEVVRISVDELAVLDLFIIGVSAIHVSTATEGPISTPPHEVSRPSKVPIQARGRLTYPILSGSTR